MPNNTPVIPELITVHLGTPSSSAENVTVPFADYIKNVASSEIYPTWPDSALRANIYAQLSIALSRIYNEYYRSRGYDFDITNSTAYDQSYQPGRDIFENIGEIVDEIFNSYIRRDGFVEPLFAQYCDGIEVTCSGLSQWGTVTLAEQGLTPYQILQRYYGSDIGLVRNVPVIEGGTPSSAPTRPLRLGDANNDVLAVQTRLNRIGRNYPAIPRIADPDGVYDAATERAVRVFQQTFNLTPDGVVGSATWYRILAIYGAVKCLSELLSEGLTFSDISARYPGVLRRGDSGSGVRIVQYYLAFAGQFDDRIPIPATDGVFGAGTEEAVKAFQRRQGLDPDGIVGEDTYYRLYDHYRMLVDSLPDTAGSQAKPFAGVSLVEGSRGEEVRELQRYLSVIAQAYPSVPAVAVDGDFGPATDRAVRALQALVGLPQNGIAGIATWNQAAELYDRLA